VVVNTSDIQLSEKATNPGGEENQKASRKPGRPRAAADPGKADEKVAKVGSSICTILMADNCSSILRKRIVPEKRSPKLRKRGRTRNPKRRLGR
jgi:hypothetical protein